MCKRLICLISFLVMLALAGNASADLVAQWNFDNDLADSAGSLNWTANGGAGFSTDAKEGSHSLILDGVDDYVSVTPTGPLLTQFSTKTVMLWFKANTTDGTQVLFDEGGSSNGLCIRVNDGQLEMAVQNSNVIFTAGMDFDSTDWAHVAVTFDNGEFLLYLYGAEMASVTASFVAVSNHSNTAGIGARASQDAFDNSSTGDYFGGLIDDVRIYDDVLLMPEIGRLAGELWPYTYNPDPNDGAMILDTWITCSWMPGLRSVSHNVYLGDNFDDVNDATHESETFRSNQTTTFYLAGISGFAYPDGLVPGTTYYWRIDEVNDADPNSPWKGDVWSFWIPPLKAYNPGPTDGLEYVDPNVTFSWTGGLNSKLHYVYFGDNYDDVNNAADGLTIMETTYSPETFELDKTYYWRVDEFDGAVTNKGDVWSFTTLPVIPITDDPSLVAWWSLNEGTGITAVDWSGYGHHGAIRGSTFWAEGYDLGALEFTGPGGITGTNPRTMTAWVKTTTPNRTILSWGVNTAGQKWRMRADATSGLRVEVNGGYHYGVTNIADGQWHHVAITFEDDGTPDALDTLLYVDGRLDATADSLDEPIDTSAAGVVRIGESPWHNSPFVGLIDDVHIYNRTLTQQEIQLVMRIDAMLAWQPSPADGSTSDIDNSTPLNWMRGDMVSQHDVYFGTDKDAVKDANSSDTTGIYRASQASTSFTPSEGVEWGGGPYYWRIDENNTDGTVTRGRLWSFVVADFILIDDFEIYDVNDNQIWYAWHDGLGYGALGTENYFGGNGTGAAVGDENTASYTEEAIVYSGLQSMPLGYDNNKQGYAYYSEVEHTLTDPRDWIKHGPAELSLWFRGNPGSVGSFVENPAGTYTMTASGADIWNMADEFHFAYKMLTGAGSVIARVDSVEQTDNWAKAGVMIRETLDAGSKYAAVYITPTNADGTATNGCRFQARSDTDVSAASDSSIATDAQKAIIAPYWVKLERDVAGNFRGYYSANGSTWIQMSWNPQSIPMGSNVYIGLALTSHDTALTCQAVFSNVTISGNVAGQWANQDIGIESNDPEPLYVAVSDTTGQPAVVVHDDPAAANIETWTEWVIPIQAFTDQVINLANVDRIAIGLGTQGNITIPGGSGKMYFDDIRLYRPRDVAEE